MKKISNLARVIIYSVKCKPGKRKGCILIDYVFKKWPHVSDYSNTSEHIWIKKSLSSAGSPCQKFRTAAVSSMTDQVILVGYEE